MEPQRARPDRDRPHTFQAPCVNKNTFQSDPGGAHGPPLGARRELPLPRDARAAHARVRPDRARPVHHPRRLLLRRTARARSTAASATSRRSPASCARSRCASTTPSGCATQHFDIDRHVHRLALPAARRVRRAGRARRAPRRPCRSTARRPLWEMWVIEGLRGRQGRGLLEDAPRHRRRRLRRQPDLAPVQPRGRTRRRSSWAARGSSAATRASSSCSAARSCSTLAQPG